MLYGWVQVPGPPDASAALVANLYDKQVPLIDKFAPTDPAKLHDLPGDAVGFLNRVVPADKGAPDVNLGGFQPYAALHFQDDVTQANKDFQAASVDAVGTLRTTVYRARDGAGAQSLLDASRREATANPGAKPIDAPPGLPFAKCFEFTRNDETQTQGPRFGCFAKADRYQYEAWSQQQRDAYQQTAAQYMMLTG
jgi:hypothetical protein